MSIKNSPKTQKGVEEVNNPDASPATEEEASGEVLEPKAEPTGEAEEKKKETGKSSKKKGYQRRVRTLVKERKQAEAKAQSLEEKLAALTAPVGPMAGKDQPPKPLDDEQIVKPGEEIDVNELDKRIKAREQKILQQADAVSQLRTRQSESIARINREASDVLKDYPELNPDSEDFNKELSDSITEATEAHVKASPYTASVKKFVTKLMKPYKGAVAKEVGKATENVAKQASETALRPTSVKGGEKKFEELSIEEMEKKLGTVY